MRSSAALRIGNELAAMSMVSDAFFSFAAPISRIDLKDTISKIVRLLHTSGRRDSAPKQNLPAEI
jgi:hypothetical protein